MIAKDVTEMIGATPMVRLAHFSGAADVLAKAEFVNPGGSIKDRVALNMLRTALDSGLINAQTLIIEPTSGNTGVGLAMICAQMGLSLTLTMPGSMSLERRQLLSAYGAHLVLTEPKFGMQGAVDRALELAREHPNSFIPSQFDNPANPNAHEQATALEIWKQTGGKIDIFVASFGTGGTISGIARVLKRQNADIRVIAIEPESSPLLSAGHAGAHAIQGIGANFIPANLDQTVIDEIYTVSNDDAIAATRALARREGLLVGISSGANVHVASALARNPANSGKTIVTVLPDTGERYLSTGIFD